MCNDSPSSPTASGCTPQLLGLHCNGAMLLCSGWLKGGGLHRLGWCFRGRGGGRRLGSLLLLPVGQQCLGVLKHLADHKTRDTQFNTHILVQNSFMQCGTFHHQRLISYSVSTLFLSIPPFHLPSSLLPPPSSLLPPPSSLLPPCLFLSTVEPQCQ